MERLSNFQVLDNDWEYIRYALIRSLNPTFFAEKPLDNWTKNRLNEIYHDIVMHHKSAL